MFPTGPKTVEPPGHSKFAEEPEGEGESDRRETPFSRPSDSKKAPGESDRRETLSPDLQTARKRERERQRDSKRVRNRAGSMYACTDRCLLGWIDARCMDMCVCRRVCMPGNRSGINIRCASALPVVKTFSIITSPH